MELKTKEQILATKNWNDEYPNYMAEDEILEAMDIYAKQEAIAFSIFKSEYQNIEGSNHRHDVTEKIGMVTWRGASDEIIWKAYKEGKQLLRWIENPEHPDNRLNFKSKEQ